MSYTVLARKYRPRNFSEMVGQSHVVQALSNALITQRLHHAYLFTGTRGVGKTTVSRILAKSLNCTGSDGQGDVTAEPCGQCPACLDIDAGRFVDYTELDAASNRGVDEVQSLLEQAVYKPVQGRYKVFMIDEVHMLTNTAFNAMLKTLEEPPEYLKFVLATTDPQKVPVTVLSRCLQFNLRPMPPQTVAEHLAHVLQAEAVPFEPSALVHLGAAARGSMRDALSLTDQAIAYGQGELQEAAVRAMLGVADQRHVFEVLEALVLGDGARVVAAVDQMRLQGHPAAATLEAMASVLQRMAIAQLAGGASDEAAPDAAWVADLAERMPADETQLLYSLCLQGRAELGLAVDEYAGLVMVLLRLLAFKPEAWGQSRALAEKKSLKRTPATPTEPAQAPAAAPSSAAPVAEPQEVAVPAEAAEASAHVGPIESTEASSVAAAAPGVAASETSPSPLSDAGGRHAPEPAVTPPWEDLPTEPVKPAAVQPAQGSDAAVPAEAPPARQAPAQAEPDHPTQAAPQVEALPLDAVAPLQALMSQGVRETSARLDEPAVHGPGHEPEVSFTAEGDFWFDVVQGLVQRQAVSALARELALQSEMVARDEAGPQAHWLLRVESASLNQAGAVERLRAALAEAGHAVQLGIEVGRVHDTPGRRMAAHKQRRLKEAEALLRDDPALAPVFQSFGGTIVPGSLRAKDSNPEPGAAP